MTIRSGGSYDVDPKTGQERLIEATEIPVAEVDASPQPGAEPDPAAETTRVPRRSDKSKE